MVVFEGNGLKSEIKTITNLILFREQVSLKVTRP